MRKVIYRLSIFSQKNSSFVDEINKIIEFEPKKIVINNEVLEFVNNKLTGGKTFETSIMYQDEFRKVDEIENSNSKWLKKWKPYEKKLAEISNGKNLSLILSIEISLNNLDIPSLYFKKDFILFMNNTNIDFSLYFYD